MNTTRLFRIACNSAASISRNTNTIRPYSRPSIPTTTTLRRTSPSSRHFSTTMSQNEIHRPTKKPKTDSDGVEEWKKQPPYKIHHNNNESGEKFKALYDASCHCGKVTYQLSRKEPLDSKLCHCTTCQTQHAAPFQWAAIFHKDDINFTDGHHNLEWYDPTSKSIEHELPCKVRCNYCHSPIMDEGRNMVLLFPTLIKFKNEQEKANFKPRLHMFYNERVMDIPDGLPKWSKINNGSDSELVEDSPPDEIKALERKRSKEARERTQQEQEK